MIDCTKKKTILRLIVRCVVLTYSKVYIVLFLAKINNFMISQIICTIQIYVPA